MYINSVLYLLWSILKQDRKLIIKTVGALLLTLLVSLVAMGLPVLFSTIIHNFSNLQPSLATTTLILLASYGILWTASQVLSQIRSLIIMQTLEDTVAKLSLLLFKHLHNLSLRFHLDRKTGAVLSSIDRAQSGCESMLWGILLYMLPVCLELVGTFFVLFYYYGLLHCIGLLVLLGLFIAANVAIIQKLNKAQAVYNEKRALASSALLDSLINVETIKYFANQESDYRQCQSLLQDQKKASIKRYLLDALLSFVQMMAMGIGFGIVTYITGKRVLQGSCSVAEFILINGYFMQFIMPLQYVVHAFQQIRKGMQDMAQVYDLLQTKPEIQDSSNALALQAQEAEIVFDNVSFSYNPERAILKNISFKITQGKTIALVGPSGSGKSTLIKLLFRLFDVTSGAIYINGHDIRTLKQDSLRKLLAIVPQDVVLFNNTLRFNIAYGNLQATEQEIYQAATQAQLDKLIATLPDGLATEVGERGLKLSGGEKQRVGIARALLKKPLAYAFDEATSALDSHTEYEIQKNIREISFGTTTLIIAHRLSTVSHADEILVINNGEIVERGSHNELLETNNGLYQKLWHEQTKQPTQIV